MSAERFGTIERITIFGGSGFIGRHLVTLLASRGLHLRIACRRPHLAGHLLPLGHPGQIRLEPCDLRNGASVNSALKGSDAFVNLVGKLVSSRRGGTFQEIHVDGPRRVARAAAREGLLGGVHVSAIGASKTSPSNYGRSKFVGEQDMLRQFPKAFVVRPSLVFGPDDELFNRFARLSAFSFCLPLFGSGKLAMPYRSGNTNPSDDLKAPKFAPVYVGDLCEAIARLLIKSNGKAKPHPKYKIYEVAGPETLSFAMLMERMLFHLGSQRLLCPLPDPLAKSIAWVGQYLPRSPLTPDQLRMLRQDNIPSDHARKLGLTLSGLGIEATALDAILPLYLSRYRDGGALAERVSPTS